MAIKNINMTPLTRQQRITIYNKIIDKISLPEGAQRGVCIYLEIELDKIGIDYGYHDRTHEEIQSIYFPEFLAQKPPYVGASIWWEYNKEGDALRIAALQAAIKLVKKEFALEQISEYIKDPTRCGMQQYTGCMNITDEGKICVAGKNLSPEVLEENNTGSIGWILGRYHYNQSIVFKPESADILSGCEWSSLQAIHDCIANDGLPEDLKPRCNELDLFTYEELLNEKEKDQSPTTGNPVTE